MMDNNCVKNGIFSGSDLKLNVSFEVGNNLTMDDVDFDCTFSVGSKKFMIPKSGLVRLDSKNYIACIRANQVMRGRITCEVKVKVPDNDFDDGIRNEVVRTSLDEYIL